LSIEDELAVQKALPKRNRLMLIVQLSPLLSEEAGKLRKDEIIAYLDKMFIERSWNAEQGHRGIIGAKWTRPKSRFDQYTDDSNYYDPKNEEFVSNY